MASDPTTVDDMLRRLNRRWSDRSAVDEKEIRLVSMLVDDQLDTDHVALFLQKLRRGAHFNAVLQAFRKGELDSDRFRRLWNFFMRSKYVEDGVATAADAVWLEDERFKAAYNAGKSISVWAGDIRWRVYTLIKSAEQAARIEGDFVECGVDRGGTATCVINYLTPASFKDRQFYLFDTFQGLSEEQLTEEEKETTRITEERYPSILEDVKGNFAKFDFTRIVPGAVPGTLAEYRGERVAYLHIDMNVAYPECTALEYFWPKLAPGAPVIFDDYGFPFHAPQRRALDEVAAKLGASIMMLPTCQGLMWKTL